MPEFFENQRIRLINMPNDPDPVPPGTTGTVVQVTKLSATDIVLAIRWDNGRTLNAVLPPDEVEVVA